MTKLSKKSFALFASAVATVALALPSMASAADFDGVGNHTLTSSNLSFNAPAFGAGAACTSSVFELNVATGGASASFTGATSTGCTGTGALAGIAAHVIYTGFPWTLTRSAPGVFTLHGVHVVAIYTAAGVILTLAGTLHGVQVNNATHTVTLNNATGLTATVNGSTAAATVSGDLIDDQGSFAVT